MNVITVRYQRLTSKIDGEYPYAGAFEVGDTKEVFDKMNFKRVIARLHEILVETPSLERVIFQRCDRPGIMPVELGTYTVDQLRTDPLSAYRSMNFNPEPTTAVTGAVESSRFGRHIYLRVQNGMIEDPLTGEWLTLAYGTKQGWKIRAKNNRSSTWLSLHALVDDAPEGVSSIERIAFANWALVDVEELLKHDNTHFYLPRAWNANGPWITKEELLRLYEKHKENLS